MAKYFGLDKIKVVKDIIKFNGGMRSSLYKLYRMDDLLYGKFVGKDNFGNKYYTNDNYTFPRNRWVEYAPKVGTDYDGSQVCVEWYGWLHHKTDVLPTERPKLGYKWIMESEPNPTGTNDHYVPYSTTKPKIEAWVPPKV